MAGVSHTETYTRDLKAETQRIAGHIPPAAADNKRGFKPTDLRSDQDGKEKCAVAAGYRFDRHRCGHIQHDDWSGRAAAERHSEFSEDVRETRYSL